MSPTFSKVGNLRNIGYISSQAISQAGVFSFNFPPGKFSTPPVVSLGVLDTSGSGRDFVATITNLTKSGCSGIVRMSATLPAVTTLSVLNNYDTFVSAPANTTVVNLSAQVATTS